MSNRLTNIIAAFLLFTMFCLAFFSMLGDSLTFDELAHIPAGYSYLTQKDYRLNPEHPPLIKDLSALPLLFLNLNFPKEDPNWTQEKEAPAWWVQFDFGKKFIYYSGNCARTIIAFARIPMIFLLLFLGWFLFKWAKELGGNYAGLITLTLFIFSPVFLANARLVTTDIGAALGAVLSTYFWLKFLKNPKKLNVFLAGVTFGIAMLMKFSLILLVPFFAILTVVFSFICPAENKLKNLFKYLSLAFLAGLIGFLLVIWPIYQFHIWNYPTGHQVRDTTADLAPNKIEPLKNLTIWMADKPLLRPFSQYLRGLLMASQRTVFGNTVYFLGQISASGWWYYFPLIYFFKMPLSFHVLTVFAIAGLILCFIKRKKVINLIRENFTVFSFFLFLLIYLGTAMAGNLNIGVRHLLPILPFIIILTALGIKKLLSETKSVFLKKITIGIVVFLFSWHAYTAFSVFPHYISYFNEAAGGIENGYKLAVDSNYDWGQDFYRLLSFVGKNKINKIYLDYFGGEDPKYWLGEKYIKLEPCNLKEPPQGWVAVSVNQLMGGVAKPVPGFDQPTGYYKWLENYTPVVRIGYSIFVYKID